MKTVLVSPGAKGPEIAAALACRDVMAGEMRVGNESYQRNKHQQALLFSEMVKMAIERAVEEKPGCEVLGFTCDPSTESDGGYVLSLQVHCP